MNADTTTITTSEMFTLDRSELPNNPTRKRLYDLSTQTPFPATRMKGNPEDGYEELEVEGYFNADAVRLTRLTVRPQMVKDSRTSKQKRIFVVNYSLVADNEEVGLLGDGVNTPHPLYHEPRYRGWTMAKSDVESDTLRPHRIEAQQWVQPDNLDLLVNLLNYLNKNQAMQVTKNPRRQANRKTDDLFLVTPRSSLQVRDVREIGVPIEAFETSINPNYERGFKSFYNGLEDQRMRIENALHLGDKDSKLKDQAFEQMRINSHYITGAYAEKDNSGRFTGSWWPRRVDIGILRIDGVEFPLYRSGVDEVSEDDFQEILDQPVVPPAPTISGDDFTPKF